MRRPLVPVLVAALAGGVVFAQSPPEPLSPEGAVALALAGHPLLQAADQEVLAAEAEREGAGGGYLPRVGVDWDWVRSTNPVFVFGSKLGQERFTAADFDLDALNQPDALTDSALRLTLEQSIWDGNRTRHASQGAGHAVEAAGQTRARTRDEIAFGALRAFWDAVLADEMLTVARSAEEQARGNATLAAEQVDAGIAVPSDRLAAEVRLAEVRALRIQATHGARVARAGLSQALASEHEREFALVAPEVEPRLAAEEELEARIDEALAGRADLRALDARLQQAERGRQLAQSGSAPSVGAGARYETHGDSPFDVSGTNWTVGLAVHVPVFEGHQAREAGARAEAERLRLVALRRMLEDRIRLEIYAAWAEQASADERLGVARGALDLARETLRIVRERYAEGLAVMVELLGAEAALTQAEAGAVRARHDAALARATLDLATGRTVTGTP